MAVARTRRYPAMAGSALLHAAILIAAIVSWPWGKTLHMGDVVPVTIMTSADTAPPAPAVQSSTPQEAATPTPTPDTSAQTAAPVQQPTPPHPAPPAPKTEVAPPHPPTPPPPPKVSQAPPKQPPKIPPRAAPSEDWAALQQRLEQQSQTASGPRQSQARAGPARVSQALQPRNTEGVAATLSSGPANPKAQAALGSLSGEIGRLWNPNCGIPMGDLLIKVTFKIGPNGMLAGDPTSTDANAGDLATRVASERAVRAVRMREPFADPGYAALYGQNVTVSFSQKQHCSNK